MSIQVKRQDVLPLIAALIGIVAFFLPWIDIWSSVSGYDILTEGVRVGEKRAYLLGLFPLLFFVIVLIRLHVIEAADSLATKIIEIIPFLLLIIPLIKLANEAGINEVGKLLSDAKTLKMFFQFLYEVSGIGLLLTLLSSIVLAVTPVSKKR